ncbi:MAG: hypothetical protein ACSLE3_11310, partial [Microbacteriaceae bacterium]
HGQQRINYYHRPELLVVRPFDDEPEPNWDDEFDVDVAIASNADIVWAAEPFDPWQLPRGDHCDGGTGVRGP